LPSTAETLPLTYTRPEEFIKAAADNPAVAITRLRAQLEARAAMQIPIPTYNPVIAPPTGGAPQVIKLEQNGGYGELQASKNLKAEGPISLEAFGQVWNITVSLGEWSYNCAMATLNGLSITGFRVGKAESSHGMYPMYNTDLRKVLMTVPEAKEMVLQRLVHALKSGKSVHVFHDNIKNYESAEWYTNLKNIIPLLYERQKEFGLRIERTPIFNNKVYGAGTNPGRVWTIITTACFEPGYVASDQEKAELRNSVLLNNLKFQPGEKEILEEIVNR
jgi:hypothetical protein